MLFSPSSIWDSSVSRIIQALAFLKKSPGLLRQNPGTKILEQKGVGIQIHPLPISLSQVYIWTGF